MTDHDLLAHRSEQDPLSEGKASCNRLRIAIYSHDTMGLGHKRRALLIAQTLTQWQPNCSVLLISGMIEASSIDLPDNIDYLTLPAWEKTMDGQYQSRRLGLSVTELALLRAKTIQAAVESFKPDVLIVDNAPRGALRELDLTLEFLRRCRQTRCVLGLRDILDEPAVVRHQWRTADNETAIRRFYDAVWIYGDPKVYDLATACQFPPDIASKTRYVGYLDGQQRSPALLLTDNESTEKMALCLVGGGQDGAEIATAFVRANLPPGWIGVLVAGPFMPKSTRQWLHRLAFHRPDLTILDDASEPTQLIQQAAAVITMGGYNTICEVLSFDVKALVVPRVAPRLEQWIRAQRLQQLGLVDVLPPDQLSHGAVTDWLAAIAVQSTLPPSASRVRDCVDFNGLAHLPGLLEEVLSAQRLTAIGGGCSGQSRLTQSAMGQRRTTQRA